MSAHDSHADDDGIAASRLQLPPGPWVSLLDGLCARFPAISRERWLDRFAHGRVLDAQRRPLSADAPYRVGMEILYYRAIAQEAAIPFQERVLLRDEHLLVVDKPHFLPVTPSGGFVAETLLARLRRRYGETDLAPLHRLDRGTAGLVLFSREPATRAAYQALFRERRIVKRYEALAAPLPELRFPLLRRSRLARGEPFFRMREVEGEPNSETAIDVIERGEPAWRYALAPVSGRKHQLRVHMAALGAPILNDPYYPLAEPQAPDDYARPLKLLARSLSFADPLSGEERQFESGLSL
ncbi:pseudouridine synthase [Lysobacter silvisoli]|uniref:Pseudouridine synthase n=1 Tax=Lysobacter silvisoli TaxID=2293254 RepID=A0A371K2Y3_9GAMM|nr:pseudouridine synthase [Lysobacter silvisoli]RDZ28248.1 pseudouridine synthase [Lysobacter silvisoli]